MLTVSASREHLVPLAEVGPHAAASSTPIVEPVVEPCGEDKDVPVVLYGSWGCSCSWRVRIVLELKRVPHDKVAIMPPEGSVDWASRQGRCSAS